MLKIVEPKCDKQVVAVTKSNSKKREYDIVEVCCIGKSTFVTFGISLAICSLGTYHDCRLMT